MYVRFQQSVGFADVCPSSSNIWWEDVANNEHKELWLVRAPAAVSEISFLVFRDIWWCCNDFCIDFKVAPFLEIKSTSKSRF